MIRCTRSGLAVYLSRLKIFTDPDMRSEQVATDSEVASQMLWDAYMLGDIKGKKVVDLGCGTGILSIGAHILGARVNAYDADRKALDIFRQNADGMDIEIAEKDISEVDSRADTVIMNPPFGTRNKHIDSVFLRKAFEIADTVYSIHKTSTKSYIFGLAKKEGFEISHVTDVDFPIKAAHSHHRRDIHRIKVSIFRCLRRCH